MALNLLKENDFIEIVKEIQREIEIDASIVCFYDLFKIANYQIQSFVLFSMELAMNFGQSGFDPHEYKNQT